MPPNFVNFFLIQHKKFAIIIQVKVRIKQEFYKI